MSAPCCSTATGWCSSRAAPTCRTPRARPAAGRLPQGGIDADEDPRAAVLRELAEEIGTDRAEIIGEHPDWLTYDLPPDLVGVALRGRYRGQRQRWFALRFTGDGQRHPAGPRSAPGIRRLALGRAGRAAGAGGGFQAADLRGAGGVFARYAVPAPIPPPLEGGLGGGAETRVTQHPCPAPSQGEGDNRGHLPNPARPATFRAWTNLSV